MQIGVQVTAVPQRNAGVNQNDLTGIRNIIEGVHNGSITELNESHLNTIADTLGIPVGTNYSNVSPNVLQGAVTDLRNTFTQTAESVGVNISGQINLNSPEYADMSIQDKIFALMLSAIEKQEKSLESRFEQIAGQRAQMDTFNAASEQLNALAGQLDPTKPDSTVDISEATIQITGQDGSPQTVNLVQYLKDSGITIPDDPTKVNSETLSGIQSAVKDKTESISSTSQTDLLKLQTESSKLSRLYDMTTNMMKSLADSLANIVRNLGA